MPFGVSLPFMVAGAIGIDVNALARRVCQDLQRERMARNLRRLWPGWKPRTEKLVPMVVECMPGDYSYSRRFVDRRSK